MTTQHDDPIDRDDAPAEGWVRDLRFAHAYQSELQALISPFDRRLATRSLLHLAGCAQCRDRMASLLEDVVVAEQREEGDCSALQRFVTHDEPVIRASAARATVALSTIGATAEPAAVALLDDPDAVVRSDAIFAVCRLSEPTATAALDRIVAALADAAMVVRTAAAREVTRLGGAAMAGASDVLSRLLAPRFVELNFDGGMAAAKADTGPQAIRVSRTDDVEITASDSDSRELTIQVAVRNPALIGFGVELSAGEWIRTLPFLGVVRQPGESASIEDFVEARVTLTERERRQMPLNKKLSGRVVAITGGP